jgi:hypothetical protein
MADLQKIANMAARIMQNLLKKQAPKKTGDLKTSIKVTARVTDKNISFTTDYNKYGIYTNKGTGPYKVKKIGEWNPKPGKGKGGIKPRFWTALDSMTRTNIASLISKGLAQQVRDEIKKTTK